MMENKSGVPNNVSTGTILLQNCEKGTASDDSADFFVCLVYTSKKCSAKLKDAENIINC